MRRARMFRWLLTATVLALLGGCDSSSSTKDDHPPKAPSETTADAPMPAAAGSEATEPSADEIDPAIYEHLDDPNDPYREVYADFRARRARDMQDPSLPEPLELYPGVHLTRDRTWAPLATILPFDWNSLDDDDAASLEEAVRARLAFDHPDLKIVEMMLGPGAILPAHAGGSPGVFIVVGGSGEITVESVTQTATPGTTAKLNPYDVRRVEASDGEPLRILWIRWAPGGDQAYIDAGYFLTGANAHIQPAESDLPMDYLFWDAVYETKSVASPTTPLAPPPANSPFATAFQALADQRAALGSARDLYPGVPVFGHESAVQWLTVETLKKGGFFFSKDVAKLGAIVDRMAAISKHKAIFRAVRPDGRWDYNISETAWGPRSTYVEHSHLVPEFYYMLSGPVIYGLDGERYRVMPGDIMYNGSYSPHLAQGVVDGMPFDNFGSTWAPNGDHSVFERPFFLVEPPPAQPDGASLASDVAFHAVERP